jgi:hypothetical protein
VAKFHHDLRHVPYQANRTSRSFQDVQPGEMWGCGRTAAIRGATSGSTLSRSGSAFSVQASFGARRCAGARWKRSGSSCPRLSRRDGSGAHRLQAQ